MSTASAVHRLASRLYNASTAYLTGASTSIISERTTKSLSFKETGWFKSIKPFCIHAFKARKRYSIDRREFHLVLLSKMTESSLPFSSLTHFCKTASFFVGDRLKRTTTLRAFFTSSLIFCSLVSKSTFAIPSFVGGRKPPFPRRYFLHLRDHLFHQQYLEFPSMVLRCRTLA